MNDTYSFQAIAHVDSCYSGKFGTPRQSQLVTHSYGDLVFKSNFNDINCLRSLETFTHLWLVFVFHETMEQAWHPTVRPPRLGGNERVGVFASRSNFRPNPIGLSLVNFEEIITTDPRGLILRVSSLDLIHGTPILDIKPYLPYVESIPQASNGFASQPIQRLNVLVAPLIQARFELLPERLQLTIKESLALDPRPASCRHEKDRVFGAWFENYNICFTIQDDRLTISEIHSL